MTTFHDRALDAWFIQNTVRDPAPDLASLLALKKRQGTTVGVCLPALDEAETIGIICKTIAVELVSTGVVDRLVVIDSGSTDDTVEVAGAAGATVHRARDLLLAAPRDTDGGKGESLWKSLVVVETDIIVWLDSDTRNFGSRFVTDLVAPLLADESLIFAKAFYERPLRSDEGLGRTGGGRVTELAIRPLISLFYPALAGFIQPLSGEYAGRRDALLQIPFGVGYDVDLLMLIDLVESHGLEAVVQVDLGTRVHRNREPDELGRMSFEIMRGFFDRLEDSGRLKLSDPLPELLTQFTSRKGPFEARGVVRRAKPRPPMSSLLD